MAGYTVYFRLKKNVNTDIAERYGTVGNESVTIYARNKKEAVKEARKKVMIKRLFLSVDNVVRFD